MTRRVASVSFNPVPGRMAVSARAWPSFLAALLFLMSGILPASPASRSGGRPRRGTAPVTVEPPAFPALPESLRIDDYPLETGRTWSYQVTWSEGVGADVQSEIGTIDLTILNHHELGRYSLVTMLETTELPGAERDRRLLFCLSDGRVVRRVYDAERLRAWLSGGEFGDDGAADFVFPLRPGQKWGPPDVAGNPGGYNARDVGAFVEIELPAGDFRALPVRFATRSDREISWLAPGAGVVRYEYRHFGQQSRELWELKSMRMSLPDSAATGRLIEDRLAGLIREPGFPSRRLGLAGDPTLRALLGALSVSETPEDDDGASRVYLRGGGSLLTLDRFPDGRQHAWLGRWTRGPRLLHVFFVKEGDGAAPGQRGATSAGQAPDRPSEALRAGVESARGLLLEASRLRRDGRLSEAGRAADRASLKLVRRAVRRAGDIRDAGPDRGKAQGLPGRGARTRLARHPLRAPPPARRRHRHHSDR